MASTRNKNTKGDYNLEQQNNTLINNWNSYSNSSYGIPYDTAIPTVGYIPSHMSRNSFSHNPIDIESELLGINSSNLVTKPTKCNPQFKKVPYKSFFDRLPIIMPKPLVIIDKQRPLP